jgi:hypothetical protein
MSENDEVPTTRSNALRTENAEQDPAFAAFLEAFATALRSGGDLAAGGEATHLADRPGDDVELATRLAERLYTEELARRFFPAGSEEVLGKEGDWRWCLPMVRCCWLFGWLVCRGCRDYQALRYYLYRYWLCVRIAMGRDPRAPLAPQEQKEFEALSQLLGQTYGAWLKEEQMRVELDRGGLDDVLSGRVDCCRDNAFTEALFVRLSTREAAEALLGREAFSQHSRNPWFWLCRCWCRAAIRFGCCLACARTREDWRRCFTEYQQALQDCLGPARCELTGPTGCFEEQPILEILDLGVPVTGTAAGAFFSGYTLEWRMVEGEGCAGSSGWTSDGVVYPGPGSSGTAPVMNGTLGWIRTRLLTARSYEVRVCVKTSRPGNDPPCCCIIYNLFKRFVWINRVGAAWVGGGGVYDPNAPLVHPASSSQLVPVGCCVNVHGAAWVGECNDRRIRCFSLHYAPGFLPGPYEAGFDPSVYTPLPGQAPVCYTPPDEAEKRAQPNELIANDSILTTGWQQVTTDLSTLFGGPPPTVQVSEWRLQPDCFKSTSLPAALDPEHTCASGRYTLLLDVEDTHGNHYYDTQHVWFDNKTLHLALEGIACRPLSLREAARARPCAAPWPRELRGTAYDEYIVPTDLTYPSNNFDFYTIRITRGCAGGPTYQVPITRDLVSFDADIVTGAVDPLKGTAHVGIPAPVCKADPQLGPAQHGVLTLLDMRAFDAVCAAQMPAPFRPPPGFALQRGECCAYSIQLYAQDKTVDGTGPGICHRRWAPPCAIIVCNDLPRREEAVKVEEARATHALLTRESPPEDAGSGAADEPAE